MHPFFALAFFFALSVADPAYAQVAVTILHTSEHHGTIQPIEHGMFAGLGGVERRASLIKQIRQEVEHLLVVDSGDLLMGTAMSSVYRGEVDIAAMNLMSYDAVAVGNHDFDFGTRHLKRRRQEATFPFLCTNVRPQDPDVCQRHAIKHLGPVRVGLIGIIGKKNYPDTFNRAVVREVEFVDPIVAAKQAVVELRERVEILVAITHQDTEEDLALAKAVPGLDVLIGGHTEGFDGLVPPGQTNPVQGRVELTGVGPVFVKTHRQGRTLGRLDLLYHEKPSWSLKLAICPSLRRSPRTRTWPSWSGTMRGDWTRKPIRSSAKRRTRSTGKTATSGPERRTSATCWRIWRASTLGLRSAW